GKVAELSNDVNPEAPSPDEQAVLAIVQRFLGGITSEDKGAMLGAVLPEGGATLLRNGQPLHMNLRGVVERIPFDPRTRMEERIHSPLIKVDRDIAMAWTPYEFFIDGKLDHVGTNIFSLLRHDGKWLISGVADYSRKPTDQP